MWGGGRRPMGDRNFSEARRASGGGQDEEVLGLQTPVYNNLRFRDSAEGELGHEDPEAEVPPEEEAAEVQDEASEVQDEVPSESEHALERDAGDIPEMRWPAWVAPGMCWGEEGPEGAGSPGGTVCAWRHHHRSESHIPTSRSPGARAVAGEGPRSGHLLGPRGVFGRVWCHRELGELFLGRFTQ